MKRLALLLLCAVSSAAFAQVEEVVASESRDAAAGYIGTMNYIVGKIGQECLALLGRSETPQQFVAAWQQRNLKYVLPLAKYMKLRIAEAYAEGGAEKRDALVREVASAANANGSTTVRSWLETSDRSAACKRVVAMVESGEMDITSKAPVFSEIEALREWSER